MNDIRIVSLVPETNYEQVMSPEAEERLRSFATLTVNDTDTVASQEEMRDLLAEADGCLSGWGGVQITEIALERAHRLKIIAHMGGSVKRLVPDSDYERGITVTHAAAIIAKSVGEMALLLTLAGLRRMVEHDAAYKQRGTYGDDRLPYSTNRGLDGSRVGIIGASMTGREFIRLLQAFGPGVEIWVYDPYLSERGAGELGVHKVDLPQLLSECDVVSIHAPSNENTYHMIGSEQVKMLKDGALLVNTARGRLVDYDALLPELKSGRIRAALDVYLETVPRDQIAASEYRNLENVIVAPGRSGPSEQLRRQLGAAMVDELARFFTGLEPRYKITAARRASMA